MNSLHYTANQPLFLGGQIYMWNRYAQVGQIVHMDTAQFTKFGHQSRIEILSRKGLPITITVPLKNRAFKPIHEVLIDQPERSLDKVIDTLKTNYSRAPNFETLMPCLELILLLSSREEGLTLGTLNSNLFDFLYQYLDLPLTQHWTSLMGPRPEHPSEWVADMGQKIGAKHYLGGGTAQQAYLRQEDFDARGMDFRAQDYQMPTYARGKNAPNGNAMVSILDPLFWLGLDGTRGLIGADG